MNRVKKAMGRSRGEHDAREGEDSMAGSDVAANDSKKQKSRRPPSMSGSSDSFSHVDRLPRYCFPATAVKGLAVSLAWDHIRLMLIILGRF